jgi:hypothetical protein
MTILSITFVPAALCRAERLRKIRAWRKWRDELVRMRRDAAIIADMLEGSHGRMDVFERHTWRRLLRKSQEALRSMLETEPPKPKRRSTRATTQAQAERENRPIGGNNEIAQAVDQPAESVRPHAS